MVMTLMRQFIHQHMMLPFWRMDSGMVPDPVLVKIAGKNRVDRSVGW